MKGRNFPVKGDHCIIETLSVSSDRNPITRAQRKKWIHWLTQLWSRDPKWKSPPLLSPSFFPLSLFPSPSPLPLPLLPWPVSLRWLPRQAVCSTWYLDSLYYFRLHLLLAPSLCTPKEEEYSLVSQHYDQCSKPFSNWPGSDHILPLHPLRPERCSVLMPTLQHRVEGQSFLTRDSKISASECASDSSHGKGSKIKQKAIAASCFLWVEQV